MITKNEFDDFLEGELEYPYWECKDFSTKEVIDSMKTSAEIILGCIINPNCIVSPSSLKIDELLEIDIYSEKIAYFMFYFFYSYEIQIHKKTSYKRLIAAAKGDFNYYFDEISILTNGYLDIKESVNLETNEYTNFASMIKHILKCQKLNEETKMMAFFFDIKNQQNSLNKILEIYKNFMLKSIIDTPYIVIEYKKLKELENERDELKKQLEICKKDSQNV